MNQNDLSAFDENGLIRPMELLSHLPISRSTLWKWVKEGRFPAPFKIGSITVFRLKDVHAWFAAQGKSVPDAANDAGGNIK